MSVDTVDNIVPEPVELEVELGPAPAHSPRERAANGAAAGRVVVQPSHGWPSLNLLELWEHRELLCFLAWREVKVRYKQTIKVGFFASEYASY